METATYRIEVYFKTDDYRAIVIRDKLKRLGYNIDDVYLADNYLVNADIPSESINGIAKSLAQDVTEDFTINAPYSPVEFDYLTP